MSEKTKVARRRNRNDEREDEERGRNRTTKKRVIEDEGERGITETARTVLHLHVKKKDSSISVRV